LAGERGRDREEHTESTQGARTCGGVKTCPL
jgi:hypothetical protein